MREKIYSKKLQMFCVLMFAHICYSAFLLIARNQEYFTNWAEKLLAFTVLTLLLSISIIEMGRLLRITKNIVSNETLLVALVANTVAFYFVLHRYIMDISNDKFESADDLFSIVFSTLAIYIYSFIRIMFKPTEFKMIEDAFI